MKSSVPKILLHLEGLVVLGGAVAFYREIGGSWVTFAILFLAPDLSMLGYAFGRTVGARTYNAAHTYLGPFLWWMIAWSAHRPALFPFCLIWVAHIGFDRLLGYGLKYETDFKDTHLNRV